jgi:hypothetical protein
MYYLKVVNQSHYLSFYIFLHPTLNKSHDTSYYNPITMENRFDARSQYRQQQQQVIIIIILLHYKTGIIRGCIQDAFACGIEGCVSLLWRWSWRRKQWWGIFHWRIPISIIIIDDISASCNCFRFPSRAVRFGLLLLL